MAIHKTFHAYCPRCEKDQDYEIVMRYVDYNGVLPCFKCPSCGVEVPAVYFGLFLEHQGRVVIPV